MYVPVSEAKTERIMVKAESKRLIVVPATFETVTIKYLIRPKTPRNEAQYGTYTLTKVKTPSSVSEQLVPAEYNTVTTKANEKPDYYITVTKNVLTTPVRVKEELIPAEYKFITKYVLR